jgi:hypothetical protein
MYLPLAAFCLDSRPAEAQRSLKERLMPGNEGRIVDNSPACGGPVEF